MNIVTAVRRRLRDENALLGMGRIDKYVLEEDVSNKGTLAVVVSLNGSWRTTMQTARFPRIGITIYADATRNEGGSVKSEDGFDRAMDAWTLVDGILHRPTLETVVWGGPGGVRVLFSNRETEPSEIDHPVPTTRVLRSTYDLKVG